MIATGGLLAATECSGVLLTPRLVLTAANCVCSKREITSPESGKATLIDSSACAERAYVTTIVYGKAVNEFMAHMQVQPYIGVVRPHPDFKLLLDEQQAVVARRADLAVITLQVPVESRIPPVSLSATEARAEERLTMTGYGYGKKFGQIFGLRFIRRDKVLRGGTAGDGRFLYEQQGTFLYEGFNGGPCFREERTSC
ncbi:MAG: trypsin-like peptidase domain-containing protein [Myxococcaceae bacterium]|nr:trypsin-like peptidase domain-containing protein [Myxococcaceae bacterium]